MSGLPDSGAVHDPLRQMVARYRLSPTETERLGTFLRELRGHFPGCRVRLNRNRRVMLSLRGDQLRWTLSLHQTLLEDENLLAQIPGWMRSRGRTTSDALRQGLKRAWDRQHVATLVELPDEPDLEPLGGPLDLVGIHRLVHERWFSQYPRPEIAWARASAHRRLTHMRFACYKRAPVAMILVNPRLNQPWIARIFVEHVLFHELCHHIQAVAPVRGETAHSKRFRALERHYPHHAQAMRWERRHLGRMLDIPTVPFRPSPA